MFDDNELQLIKIKQPPYPGYGIVTGQTIPYVKLLVPESWLVKDGKIDTWCNSHGAQWYYADVIFGD